MIYDKQDIEDLLLFEFNIYWEYDLHFDIENNTITSYANKLHFPKELLN